MKRPISKKKVSGAKKPQIDKSNLPKNTLDKKPVWRFGKLDFHHGEWGFNNLDRSHLIQEMHSKLVNFEKMKWKEIEGPQNHFIEINKLCREAQKRIIELRLQEFDPLFSLRLSGKERVWGIRQEEILYILWWDPDHTVYPVGKKHT